MIGFTMWVLPSRQLVVAEQPRAARQGDHLDGAAYYRTPENDAANCLYLQIRLLGYTKDYAAFCTELRDEPRPLSLLSLADFGRRLGFRLRPVNLSVSDLARTAPAIVYFEEMGIGRGRCYLFLGMDETEANIALIDGAYVTREWMSRDRFRRNWTGYALIASPPWLGGLWVRRSAVALLIGGVGGWLAFRAGKRYSTPTPTKLGDSLNTGNPS